MPSCLSGHDGSIGVQRDLPRSNFEVDLSRSFSTILFVMTSGDLNVDMTQNIFFYKSCRSLNEPSTNCRLPFVVTIRGFRDLTRAENPPSDFEPFRARPEYGQSKIIH